MSKFTRHEGAGTPLPSEQQPSVNGYRDSSWYERRHHVWDLYPGPDNPRITVVKLKQGDKIVPVEYRWWVEPCVEKDGGNAGECPGYLLEHTGPGGEWVKERECPLHTRRWQRSYMTAQEKKDDLSARLRAAMIPDMLHNWTFYSYPRKDHGAYDAVAEYARAGKLTQSLILAGPYGTGKTSLAVSVIQKRITEHGERALFTNVNTLFEEIKALFGRENESSQLLQRVMNVPLLVLDDLGAERATEWVQSNLYNILNYRLTNNKPTIVTTNLDMEELTERLGARTVERLKKPYYRVIYVGGVNMRD